MLGLIFGRKCTFIQHISHLKIGLEMVSLLDSVLWEVVFRKDKLSQV